MTSSSSGLCVAADYSSEPMTAEHMDVVVDQISRSFAEKGDLTTLAQVTYQHLYEQV